MLCDFAEKRLSPAGAAFTGGPFKIVWHTTEGDGIEGAISTLQHNGFEPHFILDGKRIIQMLNTSASAKALSNKTGGVQTNRDGAIQIEVVGHAGKDPDDATLANMIRVARWIEEKHDVPRRWPAGYPPLTATEANKPGGRNAKIWDSEGGHFGHSQVPENTHWDPAWSKAFIDRLMREPATQPKPPKPEPVEAKGDPEILALQAALKDAGFDPKGLDGDWGKFTRGALLLSIPEIDGDPKKWLAMMRKALSA